MDKDHNALPKGTKGKLVVGISKVIQGEGFKKVKSVVKPVMYGLKFALDHFKKVIAANKKKLQKKPGDTYEAHRKRIQKLCDTKRLTFPSVPNSWKSWKSGGISGYGCGAYAVAYKGIEATWPYRQYITKAAGISRYLDQADLLVRKAVSDYRFGLASQYASMGGAASWTIKGLLEKVEEKVISHQSRHKDATELCTWRSGGPSSSSQHLGSSAQSHAEVTSGRRGGSCSAWSSFESSSGSNRAGNDEEDEDEEDLGEMVGGRRGGESSSSSSYFAVSGGSNRAGNDEEDE